MSSTADVVIVGAGVNGLSTAFHLAKSGVKKVIVVERQHLAAGASGKSGALVRMHYTNEPETRLALESFKYFTHWEDMVGGQCGLQQVGLLVFTPPQYYHHLQQNVAMHQKLGANAHIITADDVSQIDPHVWCGDVTHLAYEPDSGYADPNATAFSFAHAASELGVEFRLGTTVTKVLTSEERVTGVETSAGVIESPIVLVAAGAWANQLLTPLGIDLGTVPSLARVTLFRWPPERSSKHMTYIDHIHHTWMRPEGESRTLIGAEFGIRRHENPDQFSEAVTQDYIDLCREQLVRRFPIMHHSTMRGNWSGILMESPDSRPIIDQLPQYQGLFCMTGDSGTSFKTSPAIGKCLSEWIAEGKSHTVDLTPFRSTRFAEGKPWTDEFDYGLLNMTISR